MMATRVAKKTALCCLIILMLGGRPVGSAGMGSNQGHKDSFTDPYESPEFIKKNRRVL